MNFLNGDKVEWAIPYCNNINYLVPFRIQLLSQVLSSHHSQNVSGCLRLRSYSFVLPVRDIHRQASCREVCLTLTIDVKYLTVLFTEELRQMHWRS